MHFFIRGVTVYIIYLQLGYILHGDALKFDFKPTDNKINVTTNYFYDRFQRLQVKKAMQLKFLSTC